MSEPRTEAERRHMLLLVETAQRNGYSESEITEIVDDAIEADAEIDRAA
jgi:hypothetical protein